MKKKLMKVFILLAVAAPTVMLAVPATQKPVSVRQPDGMLVTVYLHGDEHSHYATDRLGYPVEMAKDGFYYYIGADGLPSDMVMTKDSAASKVFKASVLNTMKASDVLKVYLEKTKKSNVRRNSPNMKSSAVGKRKVPVLLVEFPDCNFTIGSKKRFNDMLNKEDYDYDGATGSCYDYFKENSNGVYTPEFDVYGPVMLDHEREYYGKNDNTGAEANLGAMIKEACQKLDGEVDFSQYDSDGDGQLDYVYVYYAGMGEHDTGISSYVWPQSSYMSWTSAGTFQCDGVTVEKFATSNELQASGRFTGIGVFVHEFSHVLGLPDLYATTYTNAFTPGSWSVLAHGPYNNEGRTPPNYSAYERSELGWLTLTEMKKPEDITLAPINQNVGYRISTDDPNEYFVFENHQQQGWDKYIPGHGMLVWHIDYDSYRWEKNVVNTDSRHQYVDIVEADGIQSENTVTGDAFPGTANVTSFTDETTPSMLSWAGIRQNKPITDIQESADGVISFKVMGGHRDLFAPVDLEAETITSVSFTLKWTPCSDCDFQLLNVYEKNENGERVYVDGCENLKISPTEGTFEVKGLKPSTMYTVIISSGTQYEQVSSLELNVATIAPTFDMLTVMTAEPSAVGNSSFTANWLPLEGAESFELTVKKRTIDITPCSDMCDFTSKQLADGWTGKLSSYFSANGYYGEAAPAASLAEAGQYVESQRYGNVYSLSLWMRTMSYSSLSTLKVLGYTDTGWVEIDNVVMPQSGSAAEVKTWTRESGSLPDNVKGVRLELATKGDKAGRLLIDDIKIGYTNPDIDEVFADYDHKNVGNTQSWLVENLEKDKLYFYTVRGVSGDVKSIESEERLVQLGTTDIANVLSDCQLVVSDNELTITAGAGTQLRIYTIDGINVVNDVMPAAGICSVVLRSGLYIVQIADKTYKIQI